MVGGVDGQQSPIGFLMFTKSQALSPSGKCRPFDASADGIAISDGLGAVILKRLDEAQRDGDRIYAVLRNVSSASDGRDRSLTAPSPNGQRRALTRAYEGAGLSPDTVGLVEAHGTGTIVGDRIEFETLRDVYSESQAAPQSCALGSVKSQIGHSKNAAGLAGLIKVVKSLKHRVLPPTLVETPNDHRLSNPALHEPVLDFLAGALEESGFDLRALVRLIVTSELYALSSEAPEAGRLGADPAARYLARREARPLSPSQFADAVEHVLGVKIAREDPPESMSGTGGHRVSVRPCSRRLKSHQKPCFLPTLRSWTWKEPPFLL